jgi:PAS domain S-box-containing protein
MNQRARHPEEPVGGLEEVFRRADAIGNGADRELPGAAPSPVTAWPAEQRYRWLVATAAEGIWRFELDPPLPLDLPEDELVLAILDRGRLAECNQACARHRGFEEPRELVGLGLADLIPGSRDAQYGVILEFVRSGFRPSDSETPDPGQAGRQAFVRDRLVGMVENGCLVGGWCTQRDPIERRRAEQSLRLAQHSVDIAADAVFWLRSDASICYANSAAVRMLGYSREELTRLKAFDLNPARTPESWAAHWDRLRRENSYTFEAEFRTKAGSFVPVEVTAGYLELEGEVYNFSFARDITAGRQAAERLATLAAAVEQAADDIVVTDAAGIITYVNSAFERTTGYSRTEAVGRSPRFLESGRHDEAFYRVIDTTIATGQTWQGRFSNRTRDGRTILQDASISPIRDAAGRIVGQVSARRDVTRQVELETHLAQADKLEAIGTMAGGIAHDFNNILSAILGYTQMALRKCPEDSAIHRDLQAVLLGSRRAAELVKQILTFSRHQQRAEQPVQIGLVVKEAVKFLRASIPTTVEIRMDIRSDAAVLAEPTDLHRIVINLCTNAALAMQDHGGLLELSLAEVDLDQPFALDHPGVSAGRFVRLTVRDTGHGMTREVQAHIFEPFFTTRERGEGTGMGLAVVHGIVTRCHGAITVESEPGRGTTFELLLPRVERETPAVHAPAEPLLVGTGRILVVDDEPMVAAMVVDQLSEMGYHATACANGPAALEIFAADPRAFDLVVTDMTMPGMTGDELARRLKTLQPGLPVVLCTGYSDRITAETARAQGIDEFAMKPVAMAELSRLVRRALDGR